MGRAVWARFDMVDVRVRVLLRDVCVGFQFQAVVLQRLQPGG